MGKAPRGQTQRNAYRMVAIASWTLYFILSLLRYYLWTDRAKRLPPMHPAKPNIANGSF
jgi:hypothetical protein